MIINNNIPAMNTHRQMGINQGNMQSSMEKLSSGMRINKAGDDAAGLAISEKMRAQINGLDQASRNSQDGISMIQTAEGALDESHSILQRMRELSVQSANDTNVEVDREELQKEVDQLTDELDRISSDTEFNTQKLLNGDLQNTAELESNDANLAGASVTDANLEDGTYTATVSGVTVETGNFEAGDTNIDAASINEDAGLEPGSYSVEVEDNGSNVDVYVYDSEGEELGSALDQAADGNIEVEVGGENDGVSLSYGSTDFAEGTATFDVQADAEFSIADSEGTEVAATTVTDHDSSTVSVGGFDLDIDSTLTGADTDIVVENNAVNFHIGANEGQNIKLSMNDMSSEGLGVDELDITSSSDADEAITTINNAIESVSAERSMLGANQNRLEHTISNLDNSSENLSAAESRVRDVDMAQEMMEMTKSNVLSQASQSMLAQANQQPQSVLQLLG